MKKPAIAGGKPERSSFLVFGKPKISKQSINEVVDSLKSGWLGTGPKTHLFEEKIRKYTHARFAVGLNSCTAGLHLALNIVGVGKGTEVITTPLSFPATANVIMHLGAKPVFVDVDPQTGNIDPRLIEEKINKRTRVILPVHLYGNPCDMDPILRIARKYSLYVIEDAAHALEAVYKGKKIGSLSDFTAFSFYVTKNLTTGEGGMLTTNNKSWAEEARIRSLHGISKDAWKRYTASGFVPYETLYPGYKYNLTDVAAAIGLNQVDHIQDNLNLREKYWKMYDDAFSQNEEVTIPRFPRNIRHARHLYTLLLNLDKLTIDRNYFIEALRKENIGSGIHFTPIHLHKFYRETFGYKQGDFPYAENFGKRTVSLPFSQYLTNSELRSVIAAVKKILAYFRKGRH